MHPPDDKYQQNGIPESVSRAQTILWSVLGLGVMRVSLEYPRLIRQVGFFYRDEFVFGLIIMFAAGAALIWLIGKRQNWARWLNILGTGLGLPFTIGALFDSLSYSVFSGIIGLFQVTGSVYAMLLLLKPTSSQWFTQREVSQNIDFNPPADVSDATENIKKLHALKENGAISEDEFEVAKQKILKKIA